MILTFICGPLVMDIGSSIDMIVLENPKHAEMLAAAFIQAAFNLANYLGAFYEGIHYL